MKTKSSGYGHQNSAYKDDFMMSWVFQLSLNIMVIKSSRPEVVCESGVLKNLVDNRKTPVQDSLLVNLQSLAWHFIEKEALAHTFSCEFRKIFKNNFF